MQKISLISTFGPEVKGIAPYSDDLLKALKDDKSLLLNTLDYKKIYPDFLIPMQQPNAEARCNKLIHYAKPSTWKLCADQCENLTHIQYWSVFTSYFLFYIAKRVKKNKGKIVITVHNPAAHENLPLLSHQESKLLLLADHIIVHSNSGKQLLEEKWSALKNRISVIPHGISTGNHQNRIVSRAADLEMCGLNPNFEYVIFFGNIRKYKGMQQLIKAWKKILPDHPKAKLILAGRLWEGSNPVSNLIAILLGSKQEAQWIKSLIPEANSLNIIFRLGFIPTTHLEAFCRIAKLGVFPYTKFSGQSGAVSMAASWGLPVLVSQLGALDQLAIDHNFTVPPGDHEELASSIDRALKTNKADHHELRKKQLSIADSFSWESVAHQHISLYKKLLHSEN